MNLLNVCKYQYVPIGSDAPELERKGVKKGLKDSVIIPKVKLSTLDMS